MTAIRWTETARVVPERGEATLRELIRPPYRSCTNGTRTLSRRIDLLGIDSTGRYVVVELKLSQGHNRALGQLLYYMGWVDANLGKAPCRGYIIASEITEKLRVAVKWAQGVSLAQYNLSFSVAPLAS